MFKNKSLNGKNPPGSGRYPLVSEDPKTIRIKLKGELVCSCAKLRYRAMSAAVSRA
jgi:hypothetical protein